MNFCHIINKGEWTARKTLGRRYPERSVPNVLKPLSAKALAVKMWGCEGWFIKGSHPYYSSKTSVRREQTISPTGANWQSVGFGLAVRRDGLRKTYSERKENYSERNGKYSESNENYVQSMRKNPQKFCYLAFSAYLCSRFTITSWIRASPQQNSIKLDSAFGSHLI